jgi:hypothetical protein
MSPTLKKVLGWLIIAVFVSLVVTLTATDVGWWASILFWAVIPIICALLTVALFWVSQ